MGRHLLSLELTTAERTAGQRPYRMLSRLRTVQFRGKEATLDPRTLHLIRRVFAAA